MNAPAPALDAELRDALRARLDDLTPRQATQAVERLIANYRGRTPTDAPVLRDAADVAAYAAYRMPATFEAVRAALDAFRARAGDWTPARHVDVGGGTGAATWAVADAWPGSAHETTVVDWAQPALDLGRTLARDASHPALRTATWRREPIGPALALPDADLVTVSYVLGELTDRDRASVVAEAARAGRAVVVVEPGTPPGYARVIEARARLIEAGFTVLAPCPHDAACPIEEGADWCHFAARVSRSSLHRQVKGGSLPYEDEKFSYVAAVREGEPGAARARVVRHPQTRKGQVLLDLCTRDEGLRRVTVSKRQGEVYRAARDAEWGDVWPPRSASED
ncbi:small ribosomal subunit Rsm22 family protein [Streptomyces sp. ICBB 8177]|uniref:small ribosomal subunit Rsm22 family protein n=1 Tax=Streptomyces sp. ICBB 8177 TaxID=563922 RepID=UPI000D67D3A1|nr:small ribosomal subunit Rsm22 family protein [Streptomyces sp. ICBB 8177]PWI43264.1 rRNA methyltransferase [Streptomyces sp. ICBB 8177]